MCHVSLLDRKQRHLNMDVVMKFGLIQLTRRCIVSQKYCGWEMASIDHLEHLWQICEQTIHCPVSFTDREEADALGQEVLAKSTTARFSPAAVDDTAAHLTMQTVPF